MSEIAVVLPDGSRKTVPEGATIADVAASIGAGLARAALAGTVAGKPVDLDHVVSDGDEVTIITNKSPEALSLLRHSTAHIMAEAVISLYDDVKVGIGPDIEDGFYYDFDLDHTITPDDLERIEARMAEIIAADEPFVREEVSLEEARSIFADQPYKLELLDRITDLGETISIYRHGGFVDLCRGPHLPSAGKTGAYKLMSVAGAYWMGDSDRPQLQRIYGTAWFDRKDLDAYLTRIEEAEKRDHRKLGRELDIFTMFDEAGAGLPLYLPNGARVIRLLQEWLRRDLYERGYEEVITPHIYKADVWKISGHYDFYRDNIYFFEVDESGDGEDERLSEFAVRPMNCPGHVLLYKNDLHSYRELPITSSSSVRSTVMSSPVLCTDSSALAVSPRTMPTSS